MDCFNFLLFYLPSLSALLAQLKMWIHRSLLFLLQFFLIARCAPPGFPSSGNGLWYTKPGVVWAKELLPVGNGYLAGALNLRPSNCVT